MSHIFTSVQCKKCDLYDLIVAKLLEAGWKNVSSHPLDGAILYSDGESGERSMYVQLYPYNAQSKGITEAAMNNEENNIRTSKTSNIIGVRLLLGYTPGEDGARGEVPSPGKKILTIPVVNNSAAVLPDTLCDCDYYADKDKLIFVVKIPNLIGGLRQVIYLGQPQTQYIKPAEGRETILACINGMSAIVCADYPIKSYGTSGQHYSCSVTGLLTGTAPNVEGTTLLSEPYYQSAMTGLMGRLEGLQVMGGTLSLFDGDLIKVKDEVYKVLNAAGSTPYGTYYLAIRIA